MEHVVSEIGCNTCNPLQIKMKNGFKNILSSFLIIHLTAPLIGFQTKELTAQ